VEGVMMTDYQDFFDEAPTAVFIKPLVDDEPTNVDLLIEEEDLDPAAFCPMATRYPMD
jgi:hypothetical protein